jgi:hypothetical protein
MGQVRSLGDRGLADALTRRHFVQLLRKTRDIAQIVFEIGDLIFREMVGFAQSALFCRFHQLKRRQGNENDLARRRRPTIIHRTLRYS